MIEQLPPPNVRLLFGAGDRAGVTEMTHYGQSRDVPGCIREFDLPYVGNQEVQTWVELPAEDDPRWRSYTDYKSRPAPDQSVLVFRKSWFNHRATYTKPWSDDDRFIDVDTPVVTRDCYLPGFLGGPNTRDWGILKWMPLDEAFRDAKAIPVAFLAKKTYWQYRDDCRQAEIKEEAENIFLTVINDGHCYRTYILPLCEKGKVVGHHWDKAVTSAIAYLVRNGELEIDLNLQYAAVKIAKAHITEYYVHHAKELVA
jgi:hypothetical protein